MCSTFSYNIFVLVCLNLVVESLLKNNYLMKDDKKVPLIFTFLILTNNRKISKTLNIT